MVVFVNILCTFFRSISEQRFGNIDCLLILIRRTEYVVAPSTVVEKSEYQIQVCLGGGGGGSNKTGNYIGRADDTTGIPKACYLKFYV